MLQLANLLGFAILTAVLLVGFGWGVVLEPSISLRALAGAVIAASVGLGGLGVLLARRASSRRPPNHLTLTDWGVEFDAPSRRPDLAPAESGGALSWVHVGRVEVQDRFWAMKRARLVGVTFVSREFRRGSVAMTVPRLWPWGICVPYLQPEVADEIVRLAEARFIVSEAG
ncbi:MAG: hypothetical protein L3K00_07350 [Thermoplasmata archaeon]|nr:hypothetical protein [Thermoplasmata archaeon]